MASVKVLSNQRNFTAVGPEIEIDDFEAPSLADLQSLLVASAAVNTDSDDFAIQASPQNDDRTWTDAAGAQSRGETTFGGTLQFVDPKPTDTTSIYRDVKSVVASDAAPVLALARRVVKGAAATVAAGDEINLYRVQANIPRLGKNDHSHWYSVNFLPKDDVIVNYIVPSGAATAATLTPATAITNATIGDIIEMKATYEGRNVTIGAEWASSDPTKVEIIFPGIAIVRAASAAVLITAKMPGGLISTGRSITTT